MYVDLFHRVNASLRRLKQYSYTEDLFSFFSDVLRCDNMTLFNKACVHGHCFFHQLKTLITCVDVVTILCSQTAEIIYNGNRL